MTTPAEIVTERIRVEVADGTSMEAYVARPAGGGPHPGILLLQEIFGVNAYMRGMAERLAREGYVVLTPDLFHRLTPNYEGSYEDIGASIGVAMKYTSAESEADVRASYERLSALEGVASDRVGAMGFCMGGRLAFMANAMVSLRAAVSYYGGGIATDKIHLAEKQSAPMLYFWGGKDVYIPPEQHRALADALTKLGKPYVNVEFSQADHGFFCDDRSDFNPEAAAQSWALTVAFLKSNLGR